MIQRKLTRAGFYIGNMIGGEYSWIVQTNLARNNDEDNKIAFMVFQASLCLLLLCRLNAGWQRTNYWASCQIVSESGTERCGWRV